MPETWIRFTADELRRHWRRMGWWTVFCAALAAGLYFAPQRGGGREGWLGVEIFGAFWLITFVLATENAYGRALLTKDGIRFHTWVSRRFIPWQQITDIEYSSIGPGYWCGLRLRRTRGRRLLVPGAFARRIRDKSFDEKRSTITYYWSHARPRH